MVEPGRKTDGELIGEAAEWFAALDSGGASPEMVAAWRDADPRHASAFARVTATWSQLGDLRGLDAVPASRPAAAEPEAVEQPGRRRFLTRAAAAAVVVAAGAGMALWPRDQSHHVETAIGERRTLPLPDGSMIELNTDSQLAWTFGERLRAVWIARGEAAFTVAVDAARPFVVHAGEAVARLGQGRFNVRLRAPGPEFVALVGEGRIDAGPRKLPLSPTQAARTDASGLRALAMTSAAANDLTAWQGGEIVFDGTPLAEAVAEFNRYLGRKLVLGDTAIGGTRLDGRFHVDDPRGFLKALRTGFGIQARDLGDRIVLTAT